MSDSEGPMNRPACASCKHQRKRCQESCVMAPHFPQRLTEEFLAVHKIFGIANVTRAIKALDFAGQREAVKSFIWEAMAWDNDPVHGPYQEIERLQDRIKSLEEEKKRQEIVIQNMHRQLLSQPQWDNNVANFSHDNATSLIAESSARNVNNYANQGREFQWVNPDFNYHSGFGQEQERERGGSGGGGAIYSSGFGQGRGRGYDGVWRSAGAVAGDGQGRVVMNQGRTEEGIVGKNNNNFGSSSGGVLARGGERVRGFGDHGMMQYAASRSSNLVDYTSTSQQLVKGSNQN